MLGICFINENAKNNVWIFFVFYPTTQKSRVSSIRKPMLSGNYYADKLHLVILAMQDNANIFTQSYKLKT